MSRNIRHKSNSSSTKKPARSRSHTTDNSSDDDYAGVDLISDSEEDEPDVEEVEEQAIIESAEDFDDDDSLSTPRPSIEDDGSSWDGFGADSGQDVLGDEPFFDDHMARMHAPDYDTEATVWASTNIQSDDDPGPRRVRFNLSDSSSSTASDDDDDLYPDLFMDQDSLAPSFRRRIENDEDEQNPSSEDGSYWDFDGDKLNQPEEDEESDDGESTGSSGYETDEGETTEEEDPPENVREKFLHPRSVLRRQSPDSESEEEITVTRRAPPRAGRGPRLGSWVHNASRPFAVINTDGSRLFMFKARVNRRFSHSHSEPRPQTSPVHGSDADLSMDQMSPMISNSANLMMSAMYTPLDSYMGNLGGQALGPPEAFYPFTSINANGDITQDSPSSFDEDDLDDEDLWNVEDFINFGEESSDDGGAEADENISAAGDTPRPTTATSEDQPHHLLLNPDLVGAFRKNQHKHKLMTRHNATMDSLVFAGPYSATTLRGIKDGRIAHAATPITPMRKQKLPPIDSSPLAGLASKRKFSGEQRGHKRIKSENEF